MYKFANDATGIFKNSFKFSLTKSKRNYLKLFFCIFCIRNTDVNKLYTKI